jgi:CRISPR/Cas system-associated protein Csm6
VFFDVPAAAQHRHDVAKLGLACEQSLRRKDVSVERHLEQASVLEEAFDKLELNERPLIFYGSPS